MGNLPRTPDEYRAWWAEQRPDIPYGYCWCGCGQQTKLSYRTQVSRQWFKDEPIKFVHRHATTAKPRVDFGVNRNDGLCYCGCGQATSLAVATNRKYGLVKGEPLRYVKGHENILAETYTEEDRGYETPCWIFRNQTDDGYGYVCRNGRFIYAHRYFYEREHGSLPNNYHLHHKCEVKNCVNLSHVTPMSPLEHTRLHCALGERWSKAYDHCTECGEVSWPHASQGACTRCIQRVDVRLRRGLKVNRTGKKMGPPKLNRWSELYDQCIQCHKSDRRHAARGLCVNCYVSIRRKARKD